MRVGIISDTHGLLRPEVQDGLKCVDMIIHAGDIDDQSVLDRLKEISSECTVVRGNADKDWAESIPQTAWLEIMGNKLYIIHNKGRIEEDISEADIVIYGHSHKYSVAEKDGRIWFNPGCCGKRRPDQEVSFAILDIRGKADFEFRKVVVGKPQADSKLPKDIDRIIIRAMKLTDKGKSYKEIAKTCRITEDLAESICRMYLTHPGVEAAGILQRIST